MSSHPVVVAVVDSGTNPYHEMFRAAGIRWQDLGIENLSIQRIALNESLDQDVAQDHRFWQSLARHELVAFEGTRIMAISFSKDTQHPLVLDQIGHGTATSSLVARTAPSVVVLMVQVDGNFCAPDTSCLVSPTMAEAMQWVAEQPWISVVSASLSIPTNTPDSAALHPEVAAYIAATKLAAQSGKLIVNAAGNLVVPPLTDYYNGPPWVIDVGGFESSPGGERLDASKGVDVVANFTEYGASPDSTNELAYHAGTSMATPIVSGVLGEAWAQLARTGTLPTNEAHALREALNASARPMSPTDWRPLSGPTNNTMTNVLSPTVPVLLGAAQEGWGYVTAETTARIVTCVQGGACGSPSPIDAAYQMQWQGARERYWDEMAP